MRLKTRNERKSHLLLPCCIAWSQQSNMKDSQEDDLWLSLKILLANLTHNWDQERTYGPSSVERTEGFTETWGDPTRRSGKNNNSTDPVWDEVSSLQGLLKPCYPQQTLTLFQYHPAWEEQFALRVAGLPFVVVNSQYAVWEATGPLPCLRVMPPTSDSAPKDVEDPPSAPALIGRNAPNPPHDRNCILSYILDHSGTDWNRPLTDHSQRRSAQLLELLVKETLGSCWVTLTYDELAQQQVHRSQSIRAGGGRWQVWCERVHSIKRLGGQKRQRDTNEALQRAREAYKLLEQHLVLVTATGQTYVMGTEAPVLVDCLLWGHLARALSNVHLVVVLAEFPALCRYAQHVWDAYFGDISAESADWMQWNLRANSENAFCQLPLLDGPEEPSKHRFYHALELMKQLSLQSRDLSEQLVLLQQSRLERDPLYQPNRDLLNIWNGWFMGEKLRAKAKVSSGAGVAPRPGSKSAHDQEGKSMREYQRNDEVWFTTVVVATCVSFFLVQYAG